MVQRTSKVGASSFEAITTKKKEPDKCSISNTQRVATRFTPALDLFIAKGKRKISSKIAPRKQEKVSRNMDIEKKKEEKSLFSIPQRRSISAKD